MPSTCACRAPPPAPASRGRSALRTHLPDRSRGRGLDRPPLNPPALGAPFGLTASWFQRLPRGALPGLGARQLLRPRGLRSPVGCLRAGALRVLAPGSRSRQDLARALPSQATGQLTQHASTGGIGLNEMLKRNEIGHTLAKPACCRGEECKPSDGIYYWMLQTSTLRVSISMVHTQFFKIRK